MHQATYKLQDSSNIFQQVVHHLSSASVSPPRPAPKWKVLERNLASLTIFRGTHHPRCTTQYKSPLPPWVIFPLYINFSKILSHLLTWIGVIVVVALASSSAELTWSLFSYNIVALNSSGGSWFPSVYPTNWTTQNQRLPTKRGISCWWFC